MIYVENIDKERITIEFKEVLRYLGYGKSEPDENIKKQIYSVIDELKTLITPKVCFRFCDIYIDGDEIDFGTFKVTSKNLSKNLKNCDKAVLFSATIGIETDRIIAKYIRISPSLAVIAQAVGTVLVESLCDTLCGKISDELEKDGLFLRPRFSPGYGDFKLECQKEIFAILECSKKIGVSLTDSLIMTPSKSVSGVLGVSREATCRKNDSCEACNKRETCLYSRC